MNTITRVLGTLSFLGLVSCGGSSSLAGADEAGYLEGLSPFGGLTAADAGGATTSTDSANPANSGHWDGDGVSGSPSMRISLAQQKAFFYKGSELVGVSPISSGSETHRTPKGRYKVTEKDIDHKSSLYGVIKNTASGTVVNADADTRKHRTGPGEHWELAPMPYFMRFNGAIGMHVGHLPGYAASHGCVRLPEPMAQKFFESARLGTPVIVE